MIMAEDSRRFVYKRIRREVFDVLKTMNRNGLGDLRFVLDNKLCGKDYYVIEDYGNWYDVTKYNELGNVFQFSMAIYDDTHNFRNFNEEGDEVFSKLVIKSQNELKKFVSECMDDEDAYMKNAKHLMYMSKHNLDLSNMIV